MEYNKEDPGIDVIVKEAGALIGAIIDRIGTQIILVLMLVATALFLLKMLVNGPPPSNPILLYLYTIPVPSYILGMTIIMSAFAAIIVLYIKIRREDSQGEK